MGCIPNRNGHRGLFLTINMVYKDRMSSFCAKLKLVFALFVEQNGDLFSLFFKEPSRANIFHRHNYIQWVGR